MMDEIVLDGYIKLNMHVAYSFNLQYPRHITLIANNNDFATGRIARSPSSLQQMYYRRSM